MSEQTAELLNAVSKILLRCFLMEILLLIVWTVLVLLAPDLIHRFHGNLFELTHHEIDVIQYCAIVAVKIGGLLFFGFPYFAIRLVLRKQAA